MKYIKKMFEWHYEGSNNRVPDDEDDLVELFSQKFIEEYFDEGYEIGAAEAAKQVNLWNFVNIDGVRTALIKELAEDKETDNKDFSNSDYIDFIKEKKLESEDLNEIIDKYNLGNLKYEEILAKLTREQLIDLIEDNDEEYEFKEKYYLEWYENIHPEEILIELHGKHSVEEDLYSYLFHYVDDNDIINDYINRIDFDTKVEYVRDYICSDIGLQEMLLKINKNTVDALFDVMDEENTLGNEYVFQKLYIKTNVKKEDPEDEDEITAHVLKQIKNKFGLNPKIEKEYSEYMYLINAEKYNL